MDFARSVEDLCEVYGTAPRESTQAVYLPPTDVLTPFPLQFHVRVPGLLDHCPPSAYSAEVDLHGEAMKNFRALEDALTPLLGRGSSDATASNVVEHHWSIGIIGVRLVAWPPHLNRPRAGSPAGWLSPRGAAFLTLSARRSLAPPDESLRSVADLRPHDWLVEPPCAQCIVSLTLENFAVRPNPAGLLASLGPRHSGAAQPGGPRIWRDTAPGRVGIMGVEGSLVFERGRLRTLSLLEASPARGSGYRQLDVALRRRTGPGELQTTLAVSAWEVDLKPLAAALSEFWEAPLRTSSGLDD